MNKNWKKKVTLFLTSQAISLFGSSLVQYAIIWHITLQTGSGVMMMLSTLCAFIPQVIISLFAGVWADRYNKKRIIMLADGMIALSTFFIAIFFFLGKDYVWLLFLVLAIRSFGSGIQTPTVTSFVPEITPADQLMRVNGINTTLQSIMLIVFPAVSGALLASVSLQYIFLIDVVTAIIGIFILSFVKVHYEKKETPKGQYFLSIKEGIYYTRNNKFIARSIRYLFVANFLITPLAILTPLYVTRVFGADPWFLTLNEIVFFVGNILGGVLISIWGGFKNRIHTVGLGGFICGVLSVVLGLVNSFAFYLIVMGLLGISVPLLNTPFITLFQEKVDSEKQGRIFSLVTIVTGAVMPLAMVLYGPLADHIKIESILIVTGLVFTLGAFVLIKDKLMKAEGVK